MLALCVCGTWLQGILSVFDPPRIDTKATIEAAYANGVEVKMVTGDHTAIAVETCRMLGMGTKVRARHDVSSADDAAYDPVDPRTLALAAKFLWTWPLVPLPQILNTEHLNRNHAALGTNLGDIILAANGFAEVYPEHKFQSALALALLSLLFVTLLFVSFFSCNSRSCRSRSCSLRSCCMESCQLPHPPFPCAHRVPTFPLVLLVLIRHLLLLIFSRQLWRRCAIWATSLA